MSNQIYTVEKGANLYYYGESETKAKEVATKRGVKVSKLLMFKKLGKWIDPPQMEHEKDYAEALKHEFLNP